MKNRMKNNNVRNFKYQVSIIIPIYNIHPEIFKKCLYGVISQTYSNIEIIIVDDGSTTVEDEFYEHVISIDNRIKLIRQNNQGVSAARNKGTKEATGDYIVYVDADDLVPPYMVEKLLYEIVYYDADFAIGAVKYFNNEEEFKFELKHDTREVVLERDEDFSYLRNTFVSAELSNNFFNTNESNREHICRGPYARILKKNIADSTSFPDDIAYGEDYIWNMRVIGLCHRICVFNEVIYGYRQSQNSTVYGFHSNSEQNVQRTIQMLINENKEHFLLEKKSLAYFLSTELYRLLRYTYFVKSSNMSLLEKNKKAKELLNKEPWTILKESGYRKLLLPRERFFISMCSLGLWVPLLIIWEKLKEFE